MGLHLAALSLRNWIAQRSDRRSLRAKSLSMATRPSRTICCPRSWRACRTQATVCCRPRCLTGSVRPDRCCTGEDGAGYPVTTSCRAIRRANLFVVSLDDEGTWFRYHHFFQALLRARLGQRYADAEIKAMHARASRLVPAQGFGGRSSDHALKAGDPSLAASPGREQVHPALDREDWHQFEHWIGLLPPDVSASRPRLLVAQAWLHVSAGSLAAIAALLDAAEGPIGCRAAAVQGSESTLRGEINVLRAALAQNKGDARSRCNSSEAAIAALHPGELGLTRYATWPATFTVIWGLQSCGEFERAIEFATGSSKPTADRPNALTLRVLLALANITTKWRTCRGMQESTATWQELARQSGLG